MNTNMKTAMRAVGLILLTLSPLIVAPRTVAADSPATRVRVLIFSGQNNHEWKLTTPRLKEVLETAGRFEVTVTDHPEQCDGAVLKKYDVLLSNWNTFGSPPVTNWPVAVREAYLDFVRQGGGVVTVHAGSSSFYDWPEYQQLAGGSWNLGETGHGPVHSFPVKLTGPQHPIALGLTNFLTTDELWHKAGFQPGNEVLATAFSALDKKGSGRDEPVAWVRKSGRGRSFTLLLGHDVRAMESFGFQTLLRRGTEWAATGKVAE